MITPGFSMGAEDSSSGPRACAVSTLPISPALCSYFSPANQEVVYVRVSLYLTTHSLLFIRLTVLISSRNSCLDSCQDQKMNFILVLGILTQHLLYVSQVSPEHYPQPIRQLWKIQSVCICQPTGSGRYDFSQYVQGDLVCVETRGFWQLSEFESQSHLLLPVLLSCFAPRGFSSLSVKRGCWENEKEVTLGKLSEQACCTANAM